MRLIKTFFLLFCFTIQAQNYCFNFTDFATDFVNDKFPTELKQLIDDDVLGVGYSDCWNYLKRGGYNFETRTNVDLIKQLQIDVANSKYNLKQIFENDPNEILIWKKLKDAPFKASEIIKETTDPRWLKWKDREFAKAIFGKGNKFNDHMLPRIRGDLEANNVDLTDLIQVNELHVLPKKTNGYGKKVIMDNAFIIKTKETNALGIEIEYYKVIYNDNKFSAKSPWTPNQKEEIIDFFKDNPNEKFITLEIRSANKFLEDSPVKKNGLVRLYREDIYKTLSNGVDSKPEFGEIINMNNNGFR